MEQHERYLDFSFINQSGQLVAVDLKMTCCFFFFKFSFSGVICLFMSFIPAEQDDHSEICFQELNTG